MSLKIITFINTLLTFIKEHKSLKECTFLWFEGSTDASFQKLGKFLSNLFREVKIPATIQDEIHFNRLAKQISILVDDHSVSFMDHKYKQLGYYKGTGTHDLIGHISVEGVVSLEFTSASTDTTKNRKRARSPTPTSTKDDSDSDTLDTMLTVEDPVDDVENLFGSRLSDLSELSSSDDDTKASANNDSSIKKKNKQKKDKSPKKSDIKSTKSSELVDDDTKADSGIKIDDDAKAESSIKVDDDEHDDCDDEYVKSKSEMVKQIDDVTKKTKILSSKDANFENAQTQYDTLQNFFPNCRKLRQFHYYKVS